MGGVYRIQTFLDFYIFFIFTRPLNRLLDYPSGQNGVHTWGGGIHGLHNTNGGLYRPISEISKCYEGACSNVNSVTRGGVSIFQKKMLRNT